MSTAANRCPLCGQPNECGLAAGKSTCWCFEIKVPSEVLDKVPPEARGTACVCQACATGQRSSEESLVRMNTLLRRRS